MRVINWNKTLWRWNTFLQGRKTKEWNKQNKTTWWLPCKLIVISINSLLLTIDPFFMVKENTEDWWTKYNVHDLECCALKTCRIYFKFFACLICFSHFLLTLYNKPQRIGCSDVSLTGDCFLVWPCSDLLIPVNSLYETNFHSLL